MRYTLPVELDKGSGKPLVLLHGLGNNYKSWAYVLEHLDYKKRRVIVPDLLGFGDAPKPDIRYTPAVHAQAVLATLDEMGMKDATFVGHSMGCLVAIEIAHQQPERVESLVLLGAPLYKTPPKGGWLRNVTRAEGLYFSLFEIVKNNPDAMQVGGKIAEELIPFIKGMEITEETWPAYRSSLEYTIMQCESYEEAEKLKVPMLFVNGVLDFFIIRKNTRRVRRSNHRFVRVRRTLGPHELTPRQGKNIARIIDWYAGR